MRHLFILLLLSTCLFAKAQLHDAQWVIGPVISVLDFRQVDTVKTYSLSAWMNCKMANSCISDEQGNLLFYTNGYYVAANDGSHLQNGDTLSPCQYTYQNYGEGLNIPQATLFLPAPSDSNLYYLFHFSNDTLNNQRPGTLYYSVIDKRENNNKGAVVAKNIPYCKGLFREGGMTACRHANGRDWWIVVPERNSNRYHIFLLCPTGITDSLVQDIGPGYSGPYDLSYSCFSTDGAKYATSAYEGYISLFDFDRCSGLFTNPRQIYNAPAGQHASGAGSLMFSPSGRFLYASDRIDLVQYDLEAQNIQDSIVVYAAADTDFAQIDVLRLAPNGKMYGSCWSGGFYFLHVINQPDSLGTACNFVWGGQPTLSDNSFNLPNLTNYKLGPLLGNGCDTIISDTRSEKREPRQLQIIPNPANKYAYVEMGWQGDFTFQLYSNTGQLIATKQTKQVDIFDTENLSNGEYIIQVTDTRNPNFMVTKKLIVQH